jgi:hypothetical protein
MHRLWIALLPALFISCGFYSFSGSSIPSHIKTVSIPLFANKTTEPGIAEGLTNTIRQAYISNNALQVTEKNANSTLLVTITAYRNEPFNYDASGNVRTYRVVISASGLFRDEVKNKDIWSENNITCEGTYSADSPRESEDDGQQRAMKELANILIESTISGW